MEDYGIICSDVELQASPRSCRYQVLHAIVNLFCRSNISVEALCHGSWLMRQLLPYSQAEICRKHLKLLGYLEAAGCKQGGSFGTVRSGQIVVVMLCTVCHALLSESKAF